MFEATRMTELGHALGQARLSFGPRHWRKIIRDLPL
jgi:hypothetical protein